MRMPKHWRTINIRITGPGKGKDDLILSAEPEEPLFLSHGPFAHTAIGSENVVNSMAKQVGRFRRFHPRNL